VILACIVLSVTNVAAFWAWRLAEVSLENARRNGHAEFLRANKAAKEYSSVVGELMVCRKDLDYVKASWDKSSSEYAKEIEKLNDNISRLIRDLGGAIENKEKMANEIDGLNVDKLHLKSELAKYRAIHEKRKAQKAANMRRFRAKQKEAKG
jgi:regulator of replication initiation timing